MSDSFLALVLMEKPATPDMVLVVKALRARYPELAPEVVDGGDAANIRQSSANSPLIRCGDEMVAVMSMPAPIPQDPGLWSRAAATWPEGETVAARHRGHLIVSVLGQNLRPLPVARLLTAVIGALIATMPECCAVVWDTKVARPAKLWMEMSRQSFAPFPDYPFTLWIDIMPFRSVAKIGAVTMGLSAFAGREIEFETNKLALPVMIERIAGLAAYLVEHGAVVKDGDTFGGDEHERITARLGLSARFAGLPVLFCAANTAS
ncbi:DUF4261 domain-containing protein [Bradyrhizobium sp. CIAT3101]|uniref:DUF4261 domain-containing protein n=1 Tax=Bradyrhizobium sp. CIAT3101 TaxID=439387 RepID=UPI0024B180C2|nr:DUF4261 domain-containing protein [Bradyrhizobium sp. CIAT3101]WFU83768.1 DUF4261 domain-containing protein [Bradyrhizobium sp. CIAT3101]